MAAAALGCVPQSSVLISESPGVGTVAVVLALAQRLPISSHAAKRIGIPDLVAQIAQTGGDRSAPR
jgi:hypothetical protein